jgi:hypothetical protein
LTSTVKMNAWHTIVIPLRILDGVNGKGVPAK